MSELDDLEFDVHEYAEQLGYTDELGRHDFSDPNLERATTKSSRGLSRRDLVVKGGLGAAALTGLGGLAGRASAAPDGERRVLGHAARDHPRRRVAAGCRAAGREGPRLQVQRAADEHERTGPEVDHRARQLRHAGRLQLPVLPDLADRQLPGRRPDQDQGVERLLSRLHEGEGASEPEGLHARSGQRALPRHVPRPGPHDGPAAHEGRAAHQQGDRPVVERRGQQGHRRQAAADVDRRATRPLQHGLDGLQRRRDQEAAGRRSRGPSSSTAGTRAASPS